MDISKIKQLREKTKAGVADCKRALEESKGDLKKAEELIKTWGVAKAEKREGRDTESGIVDAYIHNGGKVGAMVSLACETDFVARTDEFKYLAHEIAMQIAAMAPKDAKELLSQEYIRDPKLTIEKLIQEYIAKLGENITLRAFVRHSF
jgi:elongation factor Ts